MSRTDAEGARLLARLKDFFELEKNHNLFEYGVAGWSAWRVLRHPIYAKVIDLPIVEPRLSNARRSLTALVQTFVVLSLVFKRERPNVVIKTSRSALRSNRDGLFYDVHFDEFLDGGISSYKLEEKNNSVWQERSRYAVRGADLDPVLFTFWGKLLGSLFPVRASAFCERLSVLLKSEIGLFITPRRLLVQLSSVWWQARLYGFLLRRVRPKAVFVTDTSEFGLRIACKNSLIPFVEIQHGIFGSSHPDNLPWWLQKNGLDLLLPDILACWGNYWVDQVSDLQRKTTKVLAVGNGSIDAARCLREGRPQARPFHIVITSQGVDIDRFCDWIKSVIDLAPTDTIWRITIKLHPINDAQTTQFGQLAVNERVTVVGGAEEPSVFELLADADVHASISSACHFDAAAIGVPTFIVPLASHELLMDVVDGISFFVANSPTDVWLLRETAVSLAEAETFQYVIPGYTQNLDSLFDSLTESRVV